MCCFLRWTAEGGSRTESVCLHKGCTAQLQRKYPLWAPQHWWDPKCSCALEFGVKYISSMAVKRMSLFGNRPRVFKMGLCGLPAIAYTLNGPDIQRSRGPDSHWFGVVSTALSTCISWYFPRTNMYEQMTQPIILNQIQASIQETLEISSGWGKYIALLPEHSHFAVSVYFIGVMPGEMWELTH